MILFTCLSIWQATRGIAKQRLQNEFLVLSEKPMTTVPEIFSPQDQYKSVHLQGTLDNQHVFFLDNRFYQHQAGYDFLQIVQIPDSLPVLVNRGFVANHGDRATLPVVSYVEGQVTIKGRLYHPKRALQLSSADDTPLNWPKLIQTIDFDAIAAKLGYPIAPYVVMLDSESALAYPSAWQPIVVSPARHFGYAVQWGLLALMVLIATIVFSKRK